MNTIGSLVQTLATDGHNFHNAQVSQVKNAAGSNLSKENTLTTPTAKDVATDIAQNEADVKADAQQLQRMSNLISGRKLQFNVNDELGAVVVKVVDPNTEQVLKEIPSKDIQTLKIKLRKAIGILFDDLA